MMLAAAVKRMRARSGESLVETLASLLIAALAVVLLTTAVTTAASMNHTAAQRSAETQEQLLRASQFSGYMAESGETEAGTGTVLFVNKADAAQSVPYSGGDVAVYGGQDIVSYELLTGGA